MQGPERYREYAADCRRLAEKAVGDDKQVLLRIAEAWEQQAKLAEAAVKKDSISAARAVVFGCALTRPRRNRAGMQAFTARLGQRKTRMVTLENDLTLMLGEAVKRRWGALPRIIQEMLFDEALAAHGGQEDGTREQLALLLHHLHPRTAEHA